jgi:hypothetical protein
MDFCTLTLPPPKFPHLAVQSIELHIFKLFDPAGLPIQATGAKMNYY